ncbi:PREDICTED: serine hydrolase-like protein 2 [Dufourea novaeangliae]|uniref:Serine hydrolase-like protein 2 n=1 Tax=Dufourea novaeangliae TaxID=178035 RepID=A0A154PQW9_DUFNO|nr:PREDICTED: serine hydrolase-like protein 2 [Dufourea novaeangliae]KZC14263.1 Serine hydrolase-like protein 2 [Dufourea novaeangliae]
MSSSKKQVTEVNLPVPWGHIAAKVYGSSRGKKILVVHGILDNAGSFDRLINLLPQEYHYISIDLPGHGFSSPFPSGVPLQYFDYVYTILLVLDALKWKTCIYLAHSFGSQIGMYFSILYPGRLEKIIAIDGIMPLPIRDVVSYTQKTYNLNKYSTAKDALYTKEEVMYALKFKRQETLNTDAAEAMFKRAVTKVGDLYKYNRDPRLRELVRPIFTMQQHAEFWKKFSTPVILIVADRSSKIDTIPNLIEQARIAIKDKSDFFVVFVKGNHDVHNNYPERVAPHIYKFLKHDTKSKL